MESVQSSSERLALLYHLSQAFNSSLNLEEVLNRVMDEVIQAVRAERGFMMLCEKANTGPEDSLAVGERLVFKVARGIEQKTIEDPHFQISRGTVEKVALEGKPILTSDAQTDARFNLRQSVMILGLRSILCVPILLKDRVLGVIYVDNRLQAGIFTQADLDLLTSIASNAAVAIENARLYQVAVDKGRMEREMQMARKVQDGLLPRSIPVVKGWDFSAFWKPAREVGGDYYDFILCQNGMVCENPPSKYAILIADVTDKGMPAALFMASTRSIIRASTYHTASPSEVIYYANQLLSEESQDVLFVTLFYTQLNLANGAITYVNAGHNPPLLYRSSEQRILLLRPTGMPLGVEENSPYLEETETLAPGDLLLLYTDGITDAINAEEEEFGLERLMQVIREHASDSAAGVISAIEKAVTGHAAPVVPFDDLTLVAIRRL